MVQGGTFDASCDEEEIFFVMFAQISRVQPALRVQSLRRFIRHVQVAHEYVTTPEADFSVPLFIWIENLCLAARDDLPTAAEKNKNIINKQHNYFLF